MSLNIPNLDKLIAHLEAQPPERINMGHVQVRHWGECGTCGCIRGHANLIWLWLYDRSDEDFGQHIGLDAKLMRALIEPDGWIEEGDGAGRYPAHRVIATLKRLRDRFLATGEIVVDWGPEPSSPAWAAPQAVELTPPALPVEITRLLAVPSETAGA